MTARGGRWTVGRTRAVVAALAVGAICASLAAPVIAATNITADVAAGRALGTTVSASGSIYTIDGGTLVGPNLFHSFSDFSLAAGDTAAWVHAGGGAAGITRVINRVTGGAPSLIFGTLDSSALPNADFYFINPSGVVFGPGARVNVPGSAYFSTASALRFADGGSFSATTPSGSVLTMAAPSAFGFLGGEGGITVGGVGSTFFPGEGKLSLSAANVQIIGSTFTTGALDLFAVGNKAIDLGLTGAAPSVGALTGNLSVIDFSSLVTTPTLRGNGAIELNAGSVLVDSSTVQSTTASSPGGSVSISGDSVVVRDGAFVSTDTEGSGNGGEIAITAGALLVDHSAVQSSGGLYGVASASGSVGEISVNAVGLVVQDDGKIDNVANAIGNGSLLAINASDVTVQSGGIIFSNTFQTIKGAGNGGGVSVTADAINVDGGFIDAVTANGSTGNAGAANITATTITVQNSGSIGTSTNGAGTGGALTLRANAVAVESGGQIISETYQTSAGGGRGGDVTIIAGELLAYDGQIGSATGKGSTGDAGALTIDAPTIGIVGASAVETGTSGSGVGGVLTIQADDLVVADSTVGANTFGSGHAGSLDVNAGAVLVDLGYLQSTAYPGSTGNAGSVLVTANMVTVQDGGHIGSDTFGPGNAGSVTVDASKVTVIGNGLATAGGTGIESLSVFSGASGNSGTVVVVADTINVTNSGFISASTTGPGRAGDVSVTANSLVLDGGLLGSRAEVGSTGNAGQTTVNAGSIVIDKQGVISSDTFGPGNAGSVSVTAGSIDLSGGGAIRSDANAGSTGQSGSVLVDTQTLDLHDGGLIETNSANANAAGDITINAPSIVVDGTGSQISSANSFAGGGAAGNILIFTDPITLSNGGLINTNSLNGPAGDITLVFQNGGLLVLEGTSAQGQITTTSGTQSGGLISILGPTSILMNGGLIQALGPGNAALVTIQAGSIIESTDRPNDIAVAGVLALDSQIVDVGKSVTTSQADFVDASAVLRGQCADRRAHGQTNQLGTRSVGPYGAADAATIASAGSKIFACGRSEASR